MRTVREEAVCSGVILTVGVSKASVYKYLFFIQDAIAYL
jgi:hypothetical protein